MKRFIYIVPIIIMLLFFPIQHNAEQRANSYKNDSLAYLQYVFLRDTTAKTILDEYNHALRASDSQALQDIYLRLSEQSFEHGDYLHAREYAQKAIEANELLLEKKSMTHAYLNIYKSHDDISPHDSLSYSILEKALSMASSDDDRFESYLFMASYYGQQRDTERYDLWRRLYKSLFTERRRKLYANEYWKAESYYYILSANIDSAAIIRQRIPVPYLRYNALLALYRRHGQLAMAMHYADSADRLARREAALAGTLTTAYLQATIEKSNLEYAGRLEQISIAAAMSEISNNELLHEAMLLEAERAANKANQIESASEDKQRSFLLEKARHRQQQLETENRKAEHQTAMLAKREAGVRLYILGIVILALILFVVLLFMFFWTRTKAKAADNMQRMNEEENRLHAIALEASESRDSFIRNMTSEMQHSLSEVSQFAQILADVDKNISEEDRALYGEKVLNSSIKVVDQINSILNPKEYMPQSDRASEEARIERARLKYAQTFAVTIFLCLLSTSVYSDHTPSYSSFYDTGYGMPHRRLTVDSLVLRHSDQAYRVRFNKEELRRRVAQGVKLAVDLNEPYGHCMLLSMPVVCDYAIGDRAEFEESCQKLRSVAKSYGYMQYYYYSYLKEIERSLRENNMFQAMSVLENMEVEAKNSQDAYGYFYTCVGHMKVSKKREDPIGVIKWAHLALDASKMINEEIDLSAIYIDMFHHTHGARHTSYGDSLLRMALLSAKSIENTAHSNLERAYFCAVNNNSEEFFRHIAVYDSLNAIYSINSSYEQPVKAYKLVLEDDVDSALVVMNSMTDRFESYKFQLALASKHKKFEYALQARDSLLKLREENKRQLIDNDLLALSELNGTDSLRRIVAEQHEKAAALQAEQKAAELRKQRVALERERQNMRLEKLAIEENKRASEIELHAATVATNQLKLKAQAAKERMEAEEASHAHLQLLISVGLLALLSLSVLIVLIYFWRRRTAQLYNRLEQKNRQLNEARVSAEEAIERKERFIQNMSHELRTPLNAITGFAQLLALPADSFSDDERQRFAQHVEHNISLLSMLIDDIVDIGSVERGSYKIVYSETAVNDLARQAMGTVEYRVPADVTLTMQSTLPDTYKINTDGRRVLQVLINYLTNAIKHTVEGRITLTIELTHVDNREMLCFAVADTGTGVPPSEHENIFARFVKLEKFVQGTGLGLSICRIIAEKMNGRCYLDTDYPSNNPDTDHGARFVFEIPEKEERRKEK